MLWEGPTQAGHDLMAIDPYTVHNHNVPTPPATRPDHTMQHQSCINCMNSVMSGIRQAYLVIFFDLLKPLSCQNVVIFLSFPFFFFLCPGPGSLSQCRSASGPLQRPLLSCMYTRWPPSFPHSINVLLTIVLLGVFFSPPRPVFCPAELCVCDLCVGFHRCM